MKVKVKKLVENAVIPHYAKEGDAGLDLTATSFKIKDDKVTYGCGLAFEIPKGYVGLLFPRSSNSKKDLLLTNSIGVIDSGYRDEVTAVFKVTKYFGEAYRVGERFAQLVILPYPEIELEETEELSVTERGSKSYGSTGK
jgi:DUTP diphosphatase